MAHPITGTIVPCTLQLRWSDDGGQTWGQPLVMPMMEGVYNQLLKWNRLGMARDRVFELSWRTSTKTALNGAWVTYVMAES